MISTRSFHPLGVPNYILFHFLYREVLHQPIVVSLDYLRAKRPKRLPTVLTR